MTMTMTTATTTATSTDLWVCWWHVRCMVHEQGRRMLGAGDCVVGSLINVMGVVYRISGAEEATYAFMESFPDHFPASDSRQLLDRLVSATTLGWALTA